MQPYDSQRAVHELQQMGFVMLYSGNSNCSVEVEAILVEGFVGNEKDLSVIAGLSSLTALGITESKIGRETIDIIKQLPQQLDEVSLHGSTIDNCCIESLKQLTNVATLILGDTGLSDAELRDLADSMPWCRVFRHADDSSF